MLGRRISVDVHFARKNSPEMLRASHRTTTIFWPLSNCLAMILARRPKRCPLPSITTCDIKTKSMKLAHCASSQPTNHPSQRNFQHLLQSKERLVWVGGGKKKKKKRTTGSIEDILLLSPGFYSNNIQQVERLVVGAMGCRRS